jgi:hypothetical protein
MAKGTTYRFGVAAAGCDSRGLERVVYASGASVDANYLNFPVIPD